MADNFISGQVTDDGDPVENATVEAILQDGSKVLRTVTDTNGEYIFEEGDLVVGTNDYHVVARDEVNGTYYRALGQPFITAEGTIPPSVTNRWRYSEGSGTTIADSEGSLALSYTGLSWVSDSNYEGGWRADSDGTDDYGETKNSSLIDGSCTFMLSFRAATDPGDSMMISKRTGDAGGTYMRTNDEDFSTPNLTVSTRASGTTMKASATEISPFDGEKHTLALRATNNETLSVFYDGVESDSTSIGTIDSDDGESLYTRTYQNSVGDFLFEGAVDDLIFAPEALTDEEINEEHNRRT